VTSKPPGTIEWDDQDKAIALMLAQPSMIKRPVIEAGDRVLVGFKPELYAQFFD
jgi:arsenate reductase